MTRVTALSCSNKELARVRHVVFLHIGGRKKPKLILSPWHCCSRKRLLCPWIWGEWNLFLYRISVWSAYVLLKALKNFKWSATAFWVHLHSLAFFKTNYFPLEIKCLVKLPPHYFWNSYYIFITGPVAWHLPRQVC